MKRGASRVIESLVACLRDMRRDYLLRKTKAAFYIGELGRTIWRQLNNSSRILSSVNPILYIILYLFLIPTFGFVYWFALPYQFYAPYSRAEPAAVSDTEELRGGNLNQLFRRGC